MQVNRWALREIRERSGYSTRALAEALPSRRRHSTITDIENGKRGASPELIVELAKALKVPLPALLVDPSTDPDFTPEITKALRPVNDRIDQLEKKFDRALRAGLAR